jgi:hypothetical protein
VFEKVCELNAAPGNEVLHLYLFEYIPHRAVNSVPEDATAFLRSHRAMTGAAAKWAKNSPSVDEAVKRAVRELTSIVAEAETQLSPSANIGYANFSQFVFLSLFPPLGVR